VTAGGRRRSTAFAALHLIHGNPSPENLAGGLILAWVYLKSEGLALPILLHSLGNLLALLMQVGAWFWLASAG
jgi:membrane protease YdiL (CAAX protease family)